MWGHRWCLTNSISSALFFLLLGCTIQQQSMVSSQEKWTLIQLRSSLALRDKDWPIRSDPCTSWKGIKCTNGRVKEINLSGLNRTRKGMQNPNFSLDALQDLPMLSSFIASNFPLPGPIPNWFGQIRSLQVLELTSCSINGNIPSTLGNLTALIELHLSDNNLIDRVPSSLFQLPRLTHIDLSQNLLTGLIPDSFTAPGSLISLDLSSNFLYGEIPPGIGKLSGLLFLDLSGNTLSSSLPTEFRNLSRLVDLNLASNALSGSLPNNLWSIPFLQSLDVSKNNFTGTLPDTDPRGNNLAFSCNISHNSFYGKITPIIRRFRWVDLSWNYLEDLVAGYVQGNTYVKWNCLQKVEKQRDAAECASFYAETKIGKKEQWQQMLMVVDGFGMSKTCKKEQWQMLMVVDYLAMMKPDEVHGMVVYWLFVGMILVIALSLFPLSLLLLFLFSFAAMMNSQ